MKYTFEQAKVAASKVLENLIHYPTGKTRKRTHYNDDVKTVAIALMKAQNEAG
jgi:hypothetical protein